MSSRVSSKYLQLIRSFPLRPIRTDSELSGAEAVLHELLDTRTLSPPEQDYLEILGNLIEEYEKKSRPVKDLPPHQMLAGLIEAKGVTQTEVARATRIPVSTLSELMSQKREFNVAHIEKLCAYFGLGPSAFIHVRETAAAR